MEITYLGHAGFLVETPEVILAADPWLSEDGAFDSSWFQFPCNHHLAELVRDKFSQNFKQKYIYISHEHKDHFDLKFLHSINNKDFTFIIGDFTRKVLKESLLKIKAKKLIACMDKEIVKLPGGFVQLFLDDTELNRDSAIYISLSGGNFLNFNDCRKLDEIHYIKSEYKDINVFTCQFSGATWHPTCYEYSKKEYEAVSMKKMIGKFESVARAIDTVSPGMYVPSAGPPRFLDPMLQHLNFEKINIFPLSYKFLEYLKKRGIKNSPELFDIMPGDKIDVKSLQITDSGKERVNENNYIEYVTRYAERYKDFFEERKNSINDNSNGSDSPYQVEPPSIELTLEKLKEELNSKLDKLRLSNRVTAPLYFILFDSPGRFLKVDFVKGVVTYESQIPEEDYYLIKAVSWEIIRVLNRIITWDDFSLTFRMKLNRKPDVYQKIIEAFLVLEADDLNEFCNKLLEIEHKQERIIIEAAGCKYSINRFCPHEGGDLTHSWIEDGRYLVCPRHTWKYDLSNEGKCTTNDTSINAIALEND